MGCGLIETEMVSTRAVMHLNRKTREMLTMTDYERPIAQQIFGSDVESFKTASAYICENMKPDILDINMGCPVTKVAVKSGAGSALLKDPEKASNIMMPILFIILIFMAIRVAFMPGAAEGYRFFLTPDFKQAFSPETLFTAAGQAFFSLSVGMGCMVTYASYFNEKTNLIGTSLSVSLLTLFVATLAGLVIFPAVFSAGLQPTEGPSLIFITLPEIFKDMPLAPLWSAIFFILIALAALTSTISFHEVLTAYIAEEHKLSRKVATYMTTGITIILSLITLLWTFDFEFMGKTFTSTFDIYDYGSANILLPLGGFFTCIFVGWVMKPSFFKNEISNYGQLPGKVAPALFILIRYIAPVLIMYIFLKGLGVF